MAMKLYHFPSPNPQKVTFALKELGLQCELVPVDLAKGGHRDPAFLAVNPSGRVPVLVDGDLTLPESQAILAYLGEKTGRLWPASAAGRADALKWLFFLSQHIMPAAGEVALRLGALLQRLDRHAGHHVDDDKALRGHVDDREFGIDADDAGLGGQRVGAVAQKARLARAGGVLHHHPDAAGAGGKVHSAADRRG